MDRNKRPIPSSFEVNIFDLQPTDNPMISRARVAAFYKGFNRNYSFFSDNVAAMLIDTAPGSPVCGTYDEETEDFLAHSSPDKAQNYGHIPQEPNFAWEDREDKDGVVRTYACFDVLLWTGRHPEAKNIPGKGHSMELDPGSISGSWTVVDGVEYFYYTKALMSGFCVLGDKYEPCFEGARFSKEEDGVRWYEYLKTMRESILENFKDDTKKQQKGGKNPMKLNFGYSGVLEALSAQLNPNFTEEKDWLIKNVVLTAEEGNSVVFECATSTYFNYTYDASEEGVVTNVAKADEIKFVSADEFTAAVEAKENLEAKLTEAAEKSEATVAEFTTQVEELTTQLQDKEAVISEFETERQAKEEERKLELLESFKALLTEEAMSEIVPSDMSYDDLEAKLSITYARSMKDENPTNKVPTGFELTNNGDAEIIALLSKYKKD